MTHFLCLLSYRLSIMEAAAAVVDMEEVDMDMGVVEVVMEEEDTEVIIMTLQMQ